MTTERGILRCPPRTGFWRKIAVLEAVLLVLGTAAAASAASPDSSEFKGTLVFVSDTQTPQFLETIRLRRDRNEIATRKIWAAIQAEADVAAVFHLGDITKRASSTKDWRIVNTALDGLRAAQVPIYAAMGNHEYMGTATQREKNFREKFSNGARTWFSVKFPPLAVVIFNSNFSEVTAAERAEQKAFFDTEMAALESNSAIRAILVGGHHPPYTNSRIVAPSADVERDFVPTFLAGRKSLLFLSGHSHAAEDFVRSGKHFLVLGGGGGLLHPLLTEEKRRFEDSFPLKTARRFFHYVKVGLDGESLRVAFEMLKGDFSGFETVERFSVPLPSVQTANRKLMMSPFDGRATPWFRSWSSKPAAGIDPHY